MLPLELRLNIYELIISPQRVLYCFRDFNYDDIRLEILNDYTDRPFVVLVNKQIRKETLPIFYKRLDWEFGCTRALASCFNRNDFDRKGNLGAERAMLATVKHLTQSSFVCERTASTIGKAIRFHCPNLELLTIDRVTLHPHREWTEKLPDDITAEDLRGPQARKIVARICWKRFVEYTGSSGYWRNLLYDDKRDFKIHIDSFFVPEPGIADIDHVKYLYDVDSAKILELDVSAPSFGLEDLFSE